MRKLLNTYLPVIHLSSVRLLTENSRVNREQRNDNELTYMQYMSETWTLQVISHITVQSYQWSTVEWRYLKLSVFVFLNSRYFEPNLNSLHQSNTVVLPRFFKRPDISKKFACFVKQFSLCFLRMHNINFLVRLRFTKKWFRLGYGGERWRWEAKLR